MTHRNLKTLFTSALIICALGLHGFAQSPAKPDAAKVEHFEKHVRPLLAEKCFSCHSAKKQQADLRLDSRKAMLKGNENGPVIVPGHPDRSRLIQVLQYSDDDTQMPPAGKMDSKSIQLLTDWIQAGAVFPESDTGETHDPDAWKKHWAFQPVEPPTVPDSGSTSDSPIDHFVVAKLTENNLKPSNAASPRNQIRRLYFDLIGLPPTKQQMDQFIESSNDKAYSRIVDELLASKHFGERWGRYWLDVARYADTRGYVFTKDRAYKEAYLYREWVMNSLNDDLPYDQFLIRQLAADYLDAKDGKQLAAMGYLTLGRRFLNNKHDIIDDRIDVVTRGMMGFTVTCARCHDHKYDPIPTADYYSLYGVFDSSEEPNNAPSTLRLVDRKSPVQPVVFVRGNSGRRGKKVPRQFLSALSGTDRAPFKDGSGRMELAKAIASPTNPLTARVFVNRVWSRLFGNGLVRTESDFGIRSDPPTHPKLLDHLAYEFINDNWSTKRLIRRIVLSSTYRQASSISDSIATADPENRLLSHANRRRLNFEAHRDALLSVSGQLEKTFGGESVDVTKKPFPKRRSFYAYIDRQNLPGLFRSFDFASPDTHSPGRHETTVPQQALFQLNNEFTHQAATALSRRSQNANTDDQERIRNLYTLVLSRVPTESELVSGLQFVESESDSTPATTWQYGYGSINSNVKSPTGKTQRIENFKPLVHFTGDAWQMGPTMPDKKFGWNMMRATGGHPSHGFSSIRRWISPATGSLVISGLLKHEVDKGDGVRGRVVSSRHGTIADWTVNNSKTNTVVSTFEVQTGDTIDFAVDRRGDIAHDGYTWTVQLRLLNSSHPRKSWNSTKDFSGEKPDVWAQYAHVLMMTNEFLFVD